MVNIPVIPPLLTVIKCLGESWALISDYCHVNPRISQRPTQKQGMLIQCGLERGLFYSHFPFSHFHTPKERHRAA